MDFEEKIDALRMNPELAFHDIEAMGVKIEALRVASASQYESIRDQRENFQARQRSIQARQESVRILANASENLLKNANRRQDDIDVLKKMSRRLGALVEAHEKRIAGIEGRI